MRKPKTGRLANARERQLAGALVDIYKKAQAEPNGLLCMGSTDEGTAVFFDGNDPSEALQALEDFSNNGTFEYVETLPVTLFCLHVNYDELREAGVNYGDAIHQLALSRKTSERTIERYLQMELQPFPFRKHSQKFGE